MRIGTFATHKYYYSGASNLGQWCERETWFLATFKEEEG